MLEFLFHLFLQKVIKIVFLQFFVFLQQSYNRHFEQLSKRHDDIEFREKRLNERAAEMIVQERKLQKLRTTEPCIHCGRTQTLPAPKVKADEKLAEIKAMLSKGKGA